MKGVCIGGRSVNDSKVSVVNISVAFSEIVANAWDAGATRIDITIPPNFGEGQTVPIL